MEKVLVREYNDAIEISIPPQDDKTNNIAKFRLLGGNQVVNTETGEVKDTKPYKSKYDALPAVRKSMNERRRILDTNASYKLPYVYSIGFTCADLMSYEEFNNKFTAFRKRFKRKYPDIAFMAFKEVQENKHYHLHMVLWDKNEPKKLEFDSVELFMMWGEADMPPDIRQLRTIKDIDDVAFYLCNYSDENDIKVQGLYHFPPKAHLCCYNGELKKPEPKMVNLNDLDLHMYKLRQSSKSFGYEFQTYIREEVKYA